ncbi:MAG: hypothetical protein N2746_05460 [Deltaproteobacteria bacterium]|nr:hypothetical protein [Deltaproteobacteria bacterium]
MKDEVKEFLENDEEKKLWEEIFEAFQNGGKDKMAELIKKKRMEIQTEFEKYKNELNKRLGGSI